MKFIKRYFALGTGISLFMAGFILLYEFISYGEIKSDSIFWLYLGCGLIFLSIIVMFFAVDFYGK